MAPMTGVLLRVTAGPAAGASIRLETVLYFGRAERPDGVDFSADAQMSRRHARFTRLVNGANLVEDLGSGNGTLVNGERVEAPRLLQLGDTVEMGQTTVRVERAPDEVGKGAGALEPAGEIPAVAAGVGSSADRAGNKTRSLATLPSPAPRPGSASTRARPDQPTSGSRWRKVIAGGVALVLAAAGGVVAGRRSVRSDPTTAGGADAAVGEIGSVFVESGASQVGASQVGASQVGASQVGAPQVGTSQVGTSQVGANAILAYRYRVGGDLRPLAIRAYPTGGSAGFDLDNTGSLDADGQVVTSPDRTLLFAVNQGSDTVAVFHIGRGGALSAVKGSPFPSGGTAPAGLGLSGNRLVVVNKAQDGVRDLTAVAPTVATFIVERDGSLRATGSVVTLPAGTSPTEAFVTPDGKVVVVPEEHGPLVSLTLSPEGRLAVAPSSPLALPASIFPPGFAASRQWALGLSAQPARPILYAQVVDTGDMAVLQYDPSGRLRFVRAVPDPGVSLPCWSVVNAAGTRLYTDNAGNNTMSVFDLTDPLNPRQLQLVTLKNAGNPWDLHFDPTGRFLFVLDPRDRADLVPAGSGNELHTLAVHADGTLTETADSPVPIPVPANTNPIGLAVGGP